MEEDTHRVDFWPPPPCAHKHAHMHVFQHTLKSKPSGQEGAVPIFTHENTEAQKDQSPAI